jgi:hypothetical protein
VTSEPGSPLVELLDRCEEAWRAASRVPPSEVPVGMTYAMFKLGEVIERERPGLVDRLVASLVDDETGRPDGE